MFFTKKKQEAVCSADLLFDILSDDLADGLCTDIFFTMDGQKHRFGAYGDAGETRKNVVFYLDEQEYDSREALKEKASIDGRRLYGSGMTVTVTECNGCYPDSTPRLVPYIAR